MKKHFFSGGKQFFNIKPLTLISVFITRDGTIVSGDSLATISFWDPRTCTMTQYIKSHASDILALTSNEAGTVIFSAGVDRNLIQYKQVNKTMNKNKGHERKKWVACGERRNHSHDIKSIALFEKRPIDALVTGGKLSFLFLPFF